MIFFKHKKRNTDFVFNSLLQPEDLEIKPVSSVRVIKPKQWCNARLLTGGWDSLSLASVLLSPQQVLDTLFAFLSKADGGYGGGKQTNTESVCSLHQHTACSKMLSYCSYYLLHLNVFV